MVDHLDQEWVELIAEARSCGISREAIRTFLKENIEISKYPEQIRKEYYMNKLTRK